MLASYATSHSARAKKSAQDHLLQTLLSHALKAIWYDGCLCRAPWHFV